MHLRPFQKSVTFGTPSSEKSIDFGDSGQSTGSGDSGDSNELGDSFL